MEFTSIELFENVYETCYEKLPFFKKAIIEFDIKFETLLSIYKSLFPKNVNKVKLEGGTNSCIFTPAVIDSLLYGGDKTEDEKIALRKKYYNVMPYVLAAVILIIMLYVYLFSPPSGANLLDNADANEIKEEIDTANNICSKYPLDWSSGRSQDIIRQMNFKNCKIEYTPNDETGSYDDYFKSQVEFVFEHRKPVPTSNEIINSFILKYTTFNKVFNFIQNLKILDVTKTIGSLFGALYGVWRVLLYILDYLGYKVPPTLTNQLTNQLTNVSITAPQNLMIEPIEPQRRLQITNPLTPKTSSKVPTISTFSTPLSLAPTPQTSASRRNSIPPLFLTEVTPPPSPSRRSPSPSRPSRTLPSLPSPSRSIEPSTVISGLRQRRASRTLRGGIKKSFSRKRKYSKKRSNSKSIKKNFNFKKKSDDLLTFFYKNSKNLTSLSGGLKKGYLCTITSFGATILFLTLILFFMKISYEYSQIDIKKLLSYLLKIFINEVPFFKQFSHVLFEQNGSYTTFFYNILASANTVSLYLPPIFNELLINQISFSIILKNLAFAFTLIVNILLRLSNGVLPSIKKLMEIFQEILCNDDSKIITDTFEFNKKQLIEESTKLINNTNVIQAIEDMKPKKTRTKIIL
jgi:hypothetical protein